MSLSNVSSSNSSSAFLDYGEFRSGVYIQTPNQILYFTDLKGNRIGYQWKGLLPHTTSTNDPNTDGGISDTAWSSVVSTGFFEKLASEGIELDWNAHLPTVEVSYNLPHKSLKIWSEGSNSTANDYWLFADGTVWGGVGVLGSIPDVPFKQIVPQNNVIEWSSIATEGQNQFTVPYDFTNISVFINGLLQNKSTGGYVVNGSTVTLNGSLKSGDDIHVVISNVPVKSLNYVLPSDLNNYPTKTDLGSINGSGMIGTKTGGTVDEALQYVTPQMFGAVGSLTIDNTIPLNQAIQYAKSNSLGLDLRGGPWRISSSLDFSGCYYILSDWSGRFLVDSTNFIPSNTSKYVLTFGNPDVPFGEGRVSYVNISGTLGIVSDNRTSELNGVYFKGSHFDVGYVRVNNLNGTAIMLSSVWDSCFNRLSAQNSGNINSYQVGIVSGGDTSNCLHIGAIQSENAYQKCLIIGCIRSVINTIHAERMSVISTNDGTTGLPSGLSYVNVIINVGNTTINQIIHDCRTTGTAPDGTPLAATQTSVQLNMDYSSIREASFNTSVVSTTNSHNASYEEINTFDWYITGASVRNITIKNPRILGTFYPYAYINVYGGDINNLIPVFNSQYVYINDSDITNLAFNNNIVGNINFNDCRFPSTFTLANTKSPTGFTGTTTVGETQLPVTFNNCTFLGTVSGAFQSRAVFNRGYINSVSLSSRAAFEFYNVKMNTFTFTGDRSFVTRGCICNSVTSWGTPNFIFYPPGTITERIGYDVAGSIYVCSSATTATWIKLS